MVAAPPPDAPAVNVVVVEVRGVRSARGTVRVDLCDRAHFLGEAGCALSGAAPARVGATAVVIRGVPPGRYAAQVFHDENGNGRVDRALFGIPREGIGFSRDAPVRLGPPRWDDAVVTYRGGAGRTVLTLRYFLGPRAPRSR